VQSENALYKNFATTDDLLSNADRSFALCYPRKSLEFWQQVAIDIPEKKILAESEVEYIKLDQNEPINLNRLFRNFRKKDRSTQSTILDVATRSFFKKLESFQSDNKKIDEQTAAVNLKILEVRNSYSSIKRNGEIYRTKYPGGFTTRRNLGLIALTVNDAQYAADLLLEALALSPTDVETIGALMHLGGTEALSEELNNIVAASEPFPSEVEKVTRIEPGQKPSEPTCDGDWENARHSYALLSKTSDPQQKKLCMYLDGFCQSKIIPTEARESDVYRSVHCQLVPMDKHNETAKEIAKTSSWPAPKDMLTD
jgi:hypothetical protein